MALPLKTGADLYNQQLIRARLQNLGAQPNTADVGLGQVYFNTGTNTAASLRIGYCYETGSVPKFHHVANLEDVNRLEELISALSGSSSESVASVLGRVITLEGYFSNGKAKDADLLDGHNSDYFAEAATLNDLLEDYEAFKAVFSDNSDEYINTWTEVKAFLDGIKNTEDLNAILLGINTELGKKADKATTLAGYGITDGIKYVNGIDLANGVPHNEAGYGYNQYGWKANGPALSIGIDGYLMLLQASVSDGQLYRRYIGGDYKGAWYKILDDNNYASVLNNDYLRLDGSSVMAKDALLKFQVGDDLYDWNVRRGQGFGIIDFNTKAETPQYRLGFHIGGSHYRLDISHQWGANILAYRIYDQTATEVGPWTSIIDANNYSDLITTLNNNLNVPSITIGGIKLSVVEGQLQIEGDAFATGQLSSGGIGSEGSGSGASGIVILEDWEKYDDTLAQVLGAGLGVGLRDKIAALESKATNVSVAQTLTSGKEIGAITIDGVATKLFAPATYAHTEITGLADNYLGLGGGEVSGLLNVRNDYSSIALGIQSKSTEYVAMRFTGNNDKSAYLVYNASTDEWAVTKENWKATYDLLHSGNYASVLDNAYLKLSGGGIVSGSSWGSVLSVKLNAQNDSVIRYENYDGILGYIGFGADKTPIVVTPDFKPYVILHAGNYNSYALPITGGTISGALTIQSGDDGKLIFDNTDTETYWGLIYFKQNGETYGRFGTQGTTDLSWNSNLILHSGNIGDFAFVPRTGIINNTDADTLLTNGVYLNATGNGSGNSNFPSTYSILMTFTQNSNYAAQLSVAGNAVHIRRKLDTWSAWKELAFTDSTVASATKLQTARTIWGQSFDGTANVDGKIYQNGKWVFGLHADENLFIGYDSKATGSTQIFGKSVEFYNSIGDLSMLINSSGNVGIGTSAPAYKLDVNGNVGFNGTLTLPINHQVQWGNSGLMMYGSSNALTLVGNTEINGTAKIYGVANLASRLLVGGATDDGTTALQVHGDIALRRGASSAIGAPYDTNNPTIYNRIIFDGATYGIRYYSGGWTSSVVDSHTFYVGLNNDAALIIKNNKDVHISGNLIVDGQVSSGGVAEAGTGGATGGSGLERVPFIIPANTTSFTCEHNLGTREISVSIYEDGNDFQQVLADVYLDNDNTARIVFGSATDVAHKVVIIG